MTQMQRALILAVLALLILGMGKALAFSPTPPFMTIDEYVTRHARQADLMVTFSDRVSKPSTGSQLGQHEPIRISFIYPGDQISDYWRRSIISFKQRMDEIGAAYTLHEYFSTPSATPELLDSQLKTALANDPDYLVFTLDVFKHKALVDKLLKRKRPKLILQNITTPLREWEGNQPFMYIGFDHAKGTQLLAEYFMKQFPGGGKYGLLYFTRGYVSTMRGNTFLNQLSLKSELRMAANAYTMGKTDLSRREAIGMLTIHPELKFLYACSTDVAMGAIQALKETGKLGQVMVNGWGGGSSELDAILKGEMDVTVMRINDDNGVAMAEAIVMDMEGLGNDVPTIFSGEMVLIEKGISRHQLDKLVNRAFRYSGR